MNEETRRAHARYAEWDAAYVLGALSAAERREYEDHLDTCSECQAAVAELAATAGLLSRLSPLSAEDAEWLDGAGGTPALGPVLGPAPEPVLDPVVLESVPTGSGGGTPIGRDEGPDSGVRAGFVSLARARDRRRRRVVWTLSAAAAVLLVAAVAVPVTVASVNRPTTSFALEDVANVPLEADVRLTDVAWGTRIELACSYADVYVPDVPNGGWTYTLAVVGADGSDATVSSWRAAPGTSARLSAGTALEVADIRAVEIRNAKGAVLMRYELTATSG